MAKSYTLRELKKALRDYDRRFEIVDRTKHKAVYHPDIDGEEQLYTLACHKDGDTVASGYISGIRRRFKLPAGVL